MKKIAKDSKKKIAVGIVGFPNVGKKTVINSLKMQKDKQLTVLEQPGVVHHEEASPSSLIRLGSKNEGTEGSA